MVPKYIVIGIEVVFQFASLYTTSHYVGKGAFKFLCKFQLKFKNKFFFNNKFFPILMIYLNSISIFEFL